MKLLVLTGYDDAMKSIGDLTSANHQAYALRHGYDFERVREYPKDCHPSWHKMKLIQDRLPKYDAILWLDADTVVTNPEIALHHHFIHEGLTVSTDWTYCEEWKKGHFSMGNFVITNCPRSFELLELASKREEWKNRPLWEQQAIQEEYRANESIRDTVCILERRVLNAIPTAPMTPAPEPWQPGDFLAHFTFMPNDERVKAFQKFDLEQFKEGIPPWHETVMCADLRHIACLKEILLGTRWESALEVGTWSGASTTAFIAGLKAGTVKNYTACDVGWLDEFRKVIDGTPTLLMNIRSTEVLANGLPYDIIFVDGDHSLETGIAEAELILERQPKCVLSHDVNATAVGFGNCEGPAHLHSELIRDGWTCFVDQKDRPGEMTKRGFLAATKDPEIMRVLERAFALTCY